MKLYHLSLLLVATLFLACNKDDDPALNTCEAIKAREKAGTRYFEFKDEVNGDAFIAWTSNQQVIDQVLAELAKPENERLMHINGGIAKLPDNCKLNQNWSWYFLPDDWALAELSIEVCDGTPQYVEEHLDDYLHIERYCPWSSFVLREIQKPF